MADSATVIYNEKDLASLPVGSVVMWDDGRELQVAITRDDWVDHSASDYWTSDYDRVGFPATVLYVPAEGV